MEIRFIRLEAKDYSILIFTNERLLEIAAFFVLVDRKRVRKMIQFIMIIAFCERGDIDG